MISKGISILISTYNGSKKLDKTLSALSDLNISGIPYLELILVDNASNDNTLEFTEQYWNKLGKPFPLITIMETTTGKLNAQETGLKHAQGEFILICDDDNSLYPDYLQIGFKYLNENPEIGVLGGRGIVKGEIEIPEWFNDYAYFFACAPQAPQTGNVNPTRNVVYGAGMWFRKPAYDKAKELGFKFIIGSRTGKKLSTGGEDSELCWAIKMQGFEIWYIDEMRFFHYVPSNRLNESYRKKLLNGMLETGPYGNIYIRVWKNQISDTIKHFWFKEALYTLFYIIKLPFNNNLKDFKRAFNNLIILLKENVKYDKKLKGIMDYKKKATNFS